MESHQSSTIKSSKSGHRTMSCRKRKNVAFMVLQEFEINHLIIFQIEKKIIKPNSV